MPATHLARFRVRHNECDAYGHLNNANYVRFMQEAAFDASAAVGYGMEWYNTSGFMWLARETSVEYLRPALYGETLEVKTWVDDFRRVRSRRLYEFRRAGEEALIAKASTDWVYLETASGRPVNVPPEMIAAFVPEGIAETPTPRPKFPEPSAQAPKPFVFERRVEWRDIDSVHHVNNAVYFNYIEEAGIQAAAHFGWSLTRCAAEGLAIVARHTQIEYKSPALLDDTLHVTTWLSEVGRATAYRNYIIQRAGQDEVLARARTQWVFVDIHSGRPLRIPEAMMNDFAGHAV